MTKAHPQNRGVRWHGQSRRQATLVAGVAGVRDASGKVLLVWGAQAPVRTWQPPLVDQGPLAD